MPETARPPAVVAVRCDGRGLVTEELAITVALEEECLPGRSAASLLDEGSVAKFFAVLETGCEQPALCHLDVRTRVGPRAYQFVIAQDDSSLTLVGAPLGESLRRAVDLAAEAGGMEPARLVPSALETGRPSSLQEALERLAGVHSALVETERALRATNRELQDANHEKNEIMGMVAHDLRGPLNTVALSVEALARMVPASAPTDRLIRSVRSSVQMMSRLMDDALDLSAVDAGHLQLEVSLQPLAAVVEEIVELNRLWAADRKIDIEVEDRASDLRVAIDRGRFGQVVNNLLTNAIKFSEPGSKVELTIDSVDGRARLRVADQGCGMSPEETDRIFAPFQGRARRGRGIESSTGLGLAIVKRLIDAHRGEIRVRSEPGTGTEFEILLPSGPTSSGASSPSAGGQSGGGPSSRSPSGHVRLD